MTTIMKVTPNGDGIAFGDVDAESNKIKANTNFYIQNPDSGEVNLFLDRPKPTAASWKIQNRGGDFVVQCDYLNASGKGSYYDVFKMQFDSGNLLLKAPLPISSGGTGANNRTTASRNLLQTDKNIIRSTSNDTTTNWGSQGHCVTYYDVNNLINNQPSQYGILLNLAVNAVEVHQLWMTQPSGNLCHRGGNGAGWSGTWRTILDSSNYNSYALPLSGGKITGELTLNSPLKISSGGTGANNTATASKNLLQLSNNVITSTSNDTTTNWAAKGHCISFYTTKGQLNNQPSQHGILLSLGVEAGEVHQLWMTQANGSLCHRGGNGNGWGGTWRTVLDSSNLNSWFKCGTSSTPSGNTYGIYIQY